MAEKSWIDQVSRFVFPIAVVAIGGYGAWDLLLKPLIQETPVLEQSCNFTITGVLIEIPGKNGQPAKQTKAPNGKLPLVVPAGEKRAISVQVDSPTDKGVVYTWKANYGQFDSRVTTDNQSTYIAPPTLVNDTVTIEARIQGCTALSRTVAIAVVPSALTQPLTTPLPAQSPSQTVPGQTTPGQSTPDLYSQPSSTDPFASPTPTASTSPIASPGIAPFKH